jgi:hypothetical protein
MPIPDGRARRSKFSVCRGSQALATNRVYIGSVILILENRPLGWRAEVKTMSRHLAAYFAIVGTLAFASGGAASAGQFNIPHINIPRPQISIPTPHPSVPTPHLSIPRSHISVTPHLSVSKLSVSKVEDHGRSGRRYERYESRGFTDPQSVKGGDQTASGNTSATIYSNTNGNSLAGGGGYSTVSFRCRSKGGVSNCR